MNEAQQLGIILFFAGAAFGIALLMFILEDIKAIAACRRSAKEGKYD